MKAKATRLIGEFEAGRKIGIQMNFTMEGWMKVKDTWKFTGHGIPSDIVYDVVSTPNGLWLVTFDRIYYAKLRFEIKSKHIPYLDFIDEQ